MDGLPVIRTERTIICVYETTIAEAKTGHFAFGLIGQHIVNLNWMVILAWEGEAEAYEEDSDGRIVLAQTVGPVGGKYAFL